MAYCEVRDQDVELEEGPEPGTLRCPACGQVLDEETLEDK